MREITSRYLRVRFTAVLVAIMLAAVMSHQIGQISHRNIVTKGEVATAFDESQAAIVDTMVRLNAIGVAADRGQASVARTELRRSLRSLRAARERIGEAEANAVLSTQVHELLESPMLDLFGILDEFLFTAETISAPDGSWGPNAARQIEAAQAGASLALPMIRQMKKLEHADLKRANDRLSLLSDMALVLSLLFLLALAVLVFRPLERRIVAAQEQIRHEKGVAEAASAAKSTFLATVSHEIRTPMNGVLGMADLLLVSPLDEAQARMVRVIRRSGQSLLTVINDILDYSKIEARKVMLDTAPFDLRETVEQLAELMQPQVATKGLDFVVSVDPALAPAHLGDEPRLRQILTNLVGNAVKFTQAGRVALQVDAGPVSGAKQEIRINVSDTGIGIPAEQIARIFQPFEQATNGSARAFGGTGLGLAISANLAEAMGGGIAAASTQGEGSVFTLTLHLPVAEAPGAQVAPPGPVPAAARGGSPCVLVADDNHVNQMVIGQMLELAGCEVSFAANGSEAVALFSEVRPDIVFMDVSMPVMDGYSATQAIRAQELAEGLAPTPVIGLTAHVGPEARARCLAAGMAAVVVKPVVVADLHRALRAHLPAAERETA